MKLNKERTHEVETGKRCPDLDCLAALGKEHHQSCVYGHDPLRSHVYIEVSETDRRIPETVWYRWECSCGSKGRHSDTSWLAAMYGHRDHLVRVGAVRP